MFRVLRGFSTSHREHTLSSTKRTPQYEEGSREGEPRNSPFPARRGRLGWILFDMEDTARLFCVGGVGVGRRRASLLFLVSPVPLLRSSVCVDDKSPEESGEGGAETNQTLCLHGHSLSSDGRSGYRCRRSHPRGPSAPVPRGGGACGGTPPHGPSPAASRPSDRSRRR